MKHVQFLGLVMGLTLAGVANASHNATCKSGTQERKVEVVSTSDSGAPCEVKYTKDGQSSVLWKAQNDAQFCKTKATELSDKLQSSGWNCTTQDHVANEVQTDTTKKIEETKKETSTELTRAEKRAKRKAEKKAAKEKRKAEKEAAKAKRELEKKAQDAKQDASKKTTEVKADASQKVEETKKEVIKTTETKK